VVAAGTAEPCTFACRITWPGPVVLGPGMKEAVAAPELSVMAKPGSMRPLEGSAIELKFTRTFLTGLSAASRTTAVSWAELVPDGDRFTPTTDGLACSDSLAGVTATNSTARLAVALPGSVAMIEA